MGREGEFAGWKSCRSGEGTADRQLTDILLTEFAGRSIDRKGRATDYQDGYENCAILSNTEFLSQIS